MKNENIGIAHKSPDTSRNPYAIGKPNILDQTQPKIIIHTVSGYDNIGKPLTLVEVGEEAVILDCGISVDRYAEVQETNQDPNIQELLEADAIPDFRLLEPYKNKVKAIVLSHGHFDHIGGVKYLEKMFNCPLIGTPYTIEILERLAEGKNKIKNKTIRLAPNSKYQLTDNITIELIHITHSIPQTAVVNIQTKRGAILYAIDYKFDNSPVVGPRTNKQRLAELNGQTLALIADSIRADEPRKTFSETIAKEMLRDILLGVELKDKGLIVTTFSSHIARLTSIVELGKRLGRKVVFLGRSLGKYVKGAESIGIAKFDGIELYENGPQVAHILKNANKNKTKYMLVMTGHQGEEGSMLQRIVAEELPYQLNEEDVVIFSSSEIPTPIISAKRRLLQSRLKHKHVRFFDDIHVTGHASKEDHRDMLNLVRPKHLIPSQGGMNKMAALASLAVEEGYILGKTVHISLDGQVIVL